MCLNWLITTWCDFVCEPFQASTWKACFVCLISLWCSYTAVFCVITHNVLANILCISHHRARWTLPCLHETRNNTIQVSVIWWVYMPFESVWWHSIWCVTVNVFVCHFDALEILHIVDIGRYTLKSYAFYDGPRDISTFSVINCRIIVNHANIVWK